MADEPAQLDEGFQEHWEAFDAQGRMLTEMMDVDEKLASQLSKQREVAFRAGWVARGDTPKPEYKLAPSVASGAGIEPTPGEPQAEDPRVTKGLTPVVEWLDPGERAYVVPFNAIIEKAERVDQDAGIDGFKGVGTYFVDMRSIIFSEESDEATVLIENRDGKLYAMGPRDKHRLRDMPFVDPKLVQLYWLDG